MLKIKKQLRFKDETMDSINISNDVLSKAGYTDSSIDLVSYVAIFGLRMNTTKRDATLFSITEAFLFVLS